MFPMMMTAAGSLTPARVFVMGAGVAGLQALATSKRLGAVVEAYDIRPEVKDQVVSVGGKFVELELTAADILNEWDEDRIAWGRRIKMGGLPYTTNHSLYSFYERFGKEHPNWFAASR